MSTSLAHTLNPAAGTHEVTADPHEVAAAQRAGQASLGEFPYYQARFPSRGALFALSDGAWLTTLAAEGEVHVRSQVLWLGGVLAARGIPRWLLERHIRVLHGELVRGRSGADRYQSLRAGADYLAEVRREHMPDSEFHGMARGFDEAVAGLSGAIPCMGQVLVGAVVDGSAGLPRAVERVAEWSTDPLRFPPLWCQAVSDTLSNAQHAAASYRRKPRT